MTCIREAEDSTCCAEAGWGRTAGAQAGPSPSPATQELAGISIKKISFQADLPNTDWQLLAETLHQWILKGPAS